MNHGWHVFRRANTWYLLWSLSFGDVLVPDLDPRVTQRLQQVGRVQTHEVGNLVCHCGEASQKGGQVTRHGRRLRLLQNKIVTLPLRPNSGSNLRLGNSSEALALSTMDGINGEEAKRVDSFKFPGVYISEDPSRCVRTARLSKKARQRLFFPWTPRHNELPPGQPTKFAMEGVLTYGCSVWFTEAAEERAAAHHQKRLSRLSAPRSRAQGGSTRAASEDGP